MINIPQQKSLCPSSWFSAERLVAVSRILFVEYILGLGIWVALSDGLKDMSGTPLGADFINVYAAGVMIWRGQAASAYDWAAHRLVEHEITGYDSHYFGWHYPPLFLFIAALVAAFPYLWAFAFYMAASFAGYWGVVRRITSRTKESFWALIAFPGVFINFGNGQNGFITTALFGGGLLALEKRPWLAGAILGALSYKPQFFVVIPLVLAAAGYWRALLATVISAITLMALSYAVFGHEVWQAFFDSAELTRTIVLEQGSTGWQKIQSVFSLTRMWGGSIYLAYTAQITIAAFALIAAALVWRNKQTTLATRAAALCGAMLLSTPYLLDYDLIVLAIPLAFLATQGVRQGFLRYEKQLLIALWLLPFLARMAGSVHIPLTPPLLVGMMFLGLSRTRLNQKT